MVDNGTIIQHRPDDCFIDGGQLILAEAGQLQVAQDPHCIPHPELERPHVCMHINLNKSNSAMQELTISLRKETNFICMITEPSVIRHRLSGIPRHYNSIPTTKDNSPRAAIFTNSSIPIILREKTGKKSPDRSAK